MPTSPTRRERLRAELTEQIVEIGRRQLEEGGVANVNWRKIAGEVGMNPASLYTYVDGINDLYTRILSDSFRSLATAIDAAAVSSSDGSPRDRLIASARAYRRWAVARPREFNLIFTDQIPGYVAPESGPTFDAAMAVNAPFIAALGDLGVEVDAASGDPFPYALRSMLHGFTILEINGHSPYVDDREDLMIDALESLIDLHLRVTR